MCWTLDALFNGPISDGPRLLFKGGTSLSKGFGLIERFYEDIDITVGREDLGGGASIEELESFSRKKREAKLDAIKATCQVFIGGPLQMQLQDIMTTMIADTGLVADGARIKIDDDDASRQNLSLWFPTVTAPPRTAISARP